MSHESRFEKEEMCQHWLRGHCMYGDSCRYSHPKELFASKKSRNNNNNNNDNNNKKRRLRRKNTRRDSAVRHWILDNIGRKILYNGANNNNCSNIPTSNENMNQMNDDKTKSNRSNMNDARKNIDDSNNKLKKNEEESNFASMSSEIFLHGTIIDIAGGKGQLSFEFVNLNGINSIVIDPRCCLQLERWKNGIIRGYFHTNKIISEKYIDIKHDIIKKNGVKYPKHLRLFFDESFLNPKLFLHKKSDDDDDDDDDMDYKKALNDLIDYQYNLLKKLYFRKIENKTRQFKNTNKNKAQFYKMLKTMPLLCSKCNEKYSKMTIFANYKDNNINCIDSNNNNSKTSQNMENTEKNTIINIQEEKESKNNCNMDETDAIDNLFINRENVKQDCISMIKLLSQATFLIGLHSDIATEYIVDFGLKYNIGFAIIPCCVFPNSFPKRRLKNKPNKCVRTYDQFIKYIQEKSDYIKKDTLDGMDGQNTVLYFVPQ